MNDEAPLVKLRMCFVGDSTPEKTKKGYFRLVYYDVIIKQEGIKLFVKRADERIKGESRQDYNNLDEFTEDWITGFKWITRRATLAPIVK